MSFLSHAYLWIKVFHIIFMIAWMAALFYLPRLYAYHVRSGGEKSGAHDLFRVMERRLLKIIATPAMILTWLFGIILTMVPGVIDWQQFWPWIKFFAVIGMTWFHFWLASKRIELQDGNCYVSERYFKLMNEVPTVLLLLIVIMVIIRPF